MLLGTDVPELVSWLMRKDKALMVVTRSQASRLRRNQPGQDNGRQDISLSGSVEMVERSATADRGVAIESVSSETEE